MSRLQREGQESSLKPSGPAQERGIQQSSFPIFNLFFIFFALFFIFIYLKYLIYITKTLYKNILKNADQTFEKC